MTRKLVTEMNLVKRFNYVPGVTVFFFENGIPHTGIVKEVYSNYVVLNNVTYLDKKYDSDEWKVPADEIYKTDCIFLPKYPSFMEQAIVMAIVNQCSMNLDRSKIDYGMYFKFAPKKSLYHKFNDHPYTFLCPDNYITFDDFTVLDFIDGTIDVEDKGTMRVFKVHTFNGTKTKYQITVVEEYLSDIRIPDKIYIPEWKDGIRSGYLLEDDKRDDIDSHYRLRFYKISDILERIKYNSNINEESIKTVWHLSDITREKYNVDTKNPLTYTKKDLNGLRIEHRYYDMQYVKDE